MHVFFKSALTNVVRPTCLELHALLTSPSAAQFPIELLGPGQSLSREHCSDHSLAALRCKACMHEAPVPLCSLSKAHRRSNDN